MSMQGKKTKAAFEQAKKFIPYGVNSNFRYWGDDDTLVIARGKGAYIWDLDGKRYIDYRLGFGPIILGHAHPKVNAKVAAAIQNGTIFAWTTELEIELAEKISRFTGNDKVRLSNTGTEATMHALRLARAYTSREKYIKFEGQYHGMHDYVLYSTPASPVDALGSRRNPINAATSSGIPKGIAEYVFNVPFNDVERLEQTVREHWQQIAAILIEPMLGNVAGILPSPEFLQAVRQLCDEYGIVLIMDEVKTGFRIAKGGAQEYFNLKADLATYAKALGNGFPIAAIAGKEDIMMNIKPGKVALGGTYTGNQVATAAAVATLDVIETEPVFETLEARGAKLMSGIDEVLTQHNISHHMTGIPHMFGFRLGSDEPPTDYRAYSKNDDELYEEIGMHMIERGVMPETDGREPWFLCYALSDADVDETLNVFEDAVKAAK